MKDDEDGRSCALCRGHDGEIIRCTGPCLRDFHLYPQSGCHGLKLSRHDSAVVIARRGVFTCPYCWRFDGDRCSHCHGGGSTLTDCSVGGCQMKFCLDCRDRSDLASVGNSGCFICSHHFCGHCKSVDVRSEHDPLMPCLICAKAFHLRCLPPRNEDEDIHRICVRWERPHDHPWLDRDAMICSEHELSLMDYWSDRCKQWDADWVKHLNDLPIPDREKVPWMSEMKSQHLTDSTEKEDGEIDDAMATVLRPTPEADASVQNLFSEAAQHSLVRGEADQQRQTYPYDALPNLIPDTLLNELSRTIELAKKASSVAYRLLRPQFLDKYRRCRESLSSYLCPLHHQSHYTSFGRHFTKREIIEAIADRVALSMNDGDMIVDMSCGQNTFVPAVKRHCKEQGIQVCDLSHQSLNDVIQVLGRSYDIFTPYYLDDWIRKNWFDVQPKELAVGDQLVIGLNPPFGKFGRLAKSFLDRALVYRPKMIVTIAPSMLSIPHDYELLYEDSEICKLK